MKRASELRLWAGLSAAMIGALVFVSSLDQKSVKPIEWKERVVVENAQVIEREGMPKGVHYYWVFQK